MLAHFSRSNYSKARRCSQTNGFRSAATAIGGPVASRVVIVTESLGKHVAAGRGVLFANCNRLLGRIEADVVVADAPIDEADDDPGTVAPSLDSVDVEARRLEQVQQRGKGKKPLFRPAGLRADRAEM